MPKLYSITNSFNFLSYTFLKSHCTVAVLAVQSSTCWGRHKKSQTEDDDADLASMLAPFMLAPCINRLRRNPVSKKVTVMATNLHDVDKTCASGLA